MISLLIRIFKWLFVLVLPFVVLIRGAIYFHADHGFGPWLSMISGVGVTLLLLVIYMTIVHGMFSSTLGGAKAFKRRGYVAAAMLIGFCIQGLFFMSSSNLKDPALSKELRSLHPIVRMAVSIVIIIDGDLIVTDATRRNGDYERMGLPQNERSLHFPQKDGYAYAIDMRTRHRSSLRNFMLQNYFRLMGFKTLQHSGTAPHLHISLKRAKK